MLLQLLDDGRLTDSKGNLVNFRNCIIIFTSNIGSDLTNNVRNDVENYKNNYKIVFNELKRSFRPEFLNRIDEYVLFNSLSADNLLDIINLECKKVENRLMEKKIGMNISTAAKRFVVYFENSFV